MRRFVPSIVSCFVSLLFGLAIVLVGVPAGFAAEVETDVPVRVDDLQSIKRKCGPRQERSTGWTDFISPRRTVHLKVSVLSCRSSEVPELEQEILIGIYPANIRTDSG